MADVGQDENEKPSTDAPSKVEQEAEEAEVEDDETQYEEDPTSDEGAVYPLTAGRATDWPCFLALLSHIHNTLSPPFHTPILLIAQPAWTEQDHETVTQFFFEKFKTPAFCLMDSALAVCYAYGVPTATVIDVGFEKTDITAVSDFIAHDVGRGVAVLDCGGEAMTRRLLELLGPKGWTRDMCEQLKKSNICEILPRDVPLPGSTETERPNVSNPAAAASTSAVGSGAGQRPNAAALGEAPRGLGPDTDVGDEEEAGDLKAVDDEGVLDVAAIVTSGKTQEYLAKKEKEKAERAAARKAAAEAAAGPLKPTRLPNSKRERNTFIYEERRQGDQGDDAEEKIPEDKNPEDKNPETDMSVDAGEAKKPELAHNGATEKVDGENSAADGPAEATESQATGDDEAARRQQERAARKEERRRNRQTATGDPSLARREVEVGVERLMATSGGSLEKLADAVHRTVLSVQEVGKRGELWDSLIVVGNGSKVRGRRQSASRLHPLPLLIRVRLYSRLQRRARLGHHGQVPHLAVVGDHLHVGAAVELVDAAGHGRQHAAAAAGPARRWLAREPAAAGGDDGVAPGAEPVAGRARVVVGGGGGGIGAHHALVARADADQRQAGQDARVLFRVEGRRLRGGGLSGRPGGGQGRVCRRPGPEQGLHDARRVQRAGPAGHPRDDAMREGSRGAALGLAHQEKWTRGVMCEGPSAVSRHVLRWCRIGGSFSM